MSRRPHKYGAVRTLFLGRTYDSKAEAARAEQLKFEVDAGVARCVLPQPGTIRLGDDYMRFVPDFFVVSSDGHCRYEDVKGVETAKFRLIRKAWAKYGPCDLWVVKLKGKRWDVEIIKGGGKWLETMAPVGEATP